MNQIDTSFQLLLSVVVVSSLVLLAGVLFLHTLRQPIERVRCIQLTFAAWVAAMIIQQTSLLPSLSLPLLPRARPVTDQLPNADLAVKGALPRMHGAGQSSLPDAVTEPIATGSKRVDSVGPHLADTTSSTVSQNPHNWSAWSLIQAACIGVAGIGAFAHLALMAIGIRRLTTVLRDCEPADPAILAAWPHAAAASRYGVRVLISESVGVPIAVGILRPVIVMPRQIVATCETSDINFCLSHEWAHIKSGDLTTWCLLLCLRAILWIQPLYWLLQRELRTAQDQLADGFATAGSHSATDYASLLLRLARKRHNRITSFALTMTGRRSSLYRRVSLLLSDQLQLASRPRLRAILVTFLGLTSISFGVSTVRLQRASAAPPTPASTAAGGNEPAISVDDGEELSLQTEPKTIVGRVVDAVGQPAVKATVRIDYVASGEWRTESTTTDISGKFITAVPLTQYGNASLRVLAKSASGNELGYLRRPFNTDPPTVEPVMIQLESTKHATVKVKDGQGLAVAGANVIIQLAHPYILSELHSDENGLCTAQLPASERITGVVGWKDHVGFDYRVYHLSDARESDLNAMAPNFPYDSAETLILDGVAPVTVKVTDDQLQPLAGVRLYPWLLEKESEPDDLNLSFLLSIFAQDSDASGQTTFNWIPSWQKKPLQFWPSAEGFARIRSIYDVQSSKGVLEIQLDRLVPIRGTVTGVDGKPAVGILVEAAGASRLPDRARASANTDDQGRYELLVPPQQIYMVVVKDEIWASVPQDGFAVFKNQPVENKDFQLRKATRVFGTLKDAETELPVPNSTVTFYHYGKELSSLQGVTLPNPDYSNMPVKPIHFYEARTNEQGEFQISLGDGKFDIRPPREEQAVKFEVTGQAELRIDITSTPSKAQSELTGVVVAEEDQLPQRDVRLEGAPIGDLIGVPRWLAITGPDGTFRVNRFEVPTSIYALSSDEKLAAWEEVEPKQRTVTIRLSPAGSATGRLLSRDSLNPLVGKTMRLHVSGNNSARSGFSRTAVTDASGTFKLTGLLPGERYSLILAPDVGTRLFRHPIRATFTVTSEETVELGDLVGPVK